MFQNVKYSHLAITYPNILTSKNSNTIETFLEENNASGSLSVITNEESITSSFNKEEKEKKTNYNVSLPSDPGIYDTINTLQCWFCLQIMKSKPCLQKQKRSCKKKTYFAHFREMKIRYIASDEH